jgi:hypothetical protein
LSIGSLWVESRLHPSPDPGAGDRENAVISLEDSPRS